MVALKVLIKKLPSPETNPANHWGSISKQSLELHTEGISTETTFEKAAFNSSDRPKFIADLIETIFRSPSGGQVFFIFN